MNGKPARSHRRLELPKEGPSVNPSDDEPIRRAVLPHDVLIRRLDKCLNELVDISWSWLSPMELNNQTAVMMKRAYKAEGVQQMAKELYMLHILFDILQQTSGPALAQIRETLEELKTLKLPKPKKLSLPKNRYDMFRRAIIRSMFNALSAADAETGERVSFNLGDTVFFSEDD